VPRRRVGIAFLAVWLVFWTSTIFAVLYAVGAAAWRGDFAVTPFLLIWLAVAGFGLWKGAERLKRLLLDEKRTPAPPRAGRWHDGMPPDRL
jgi:hypothetical protein